MHGLSHLLVHRSVWPPSSSRHSFSFFILSVIASRSSPVDSNSDNNSDSFPLTPLTFHVLLLHLFSFSFLSHVIFSFIYIFQFATVFLLPVIIIFLVSSLFYFVYSFLSRSTIPFLCPFFLSRSFYLINLRVCYGLLVFWNRFIYKFEFQFLLIIVSCPFSFFYLHSFFFRSLFISKIMLRPFGVGSWFAYSSLKFL